ncbi:MAG: mechanosensitive ion channel [Candidatus Methanomethylicia archaeon]
MAEAWQWIIDQTTLLMILRIIITIVLAYLIVKFLEFILSRLSHKHIISYEDAKRIDAITTVFVYVVTAITIISIVTWSETIIYTLVGLLLIASGIALYSIKDIIGNLIAYYGIISVKNVRIGNIIEINNERGVIKGITPTHIEVYINEDKTIQVPNIEIFQKPILIYKAPHTVKLKVKMNRLIEFANIEENLRDILSNYKEIVKTKSPIVHVREVNDKSFECILTVYVENPMKKEKVFSDIAKILTEKLQNSIINIENIE